MDYASAVSMASIFGPFLLILGVWMLLFGDNFHKIWTSMKTTPSSFHLTAWINMLIGISILATYHYVGWDLSVLITLLGWAMLIRGFIMLYMPQMWVRTTMGNEIFMRTMGLVPLSWGVLLCWLAFWS